MRKNVAGQKVQFSLFKSGARIANPTMAAGDFKVSLDGGAQNNVSTLPTSDAAGLVTWLPSQAETNADYVALLAVDAVGDEWEPVTIVFDTKADSAIAAYLDAAVSGAATSVELAALETHGDAEWATATGFAVAGDAMALTAGERTTLVSAIWNALTSGLTTVGSIGRYIVQKLAGAITLASPVTDTDEITLYQSDDYHADDGRALEWTDDDGAWPDLTGAAVALYVRAADGTKFSKTGSVVVAGGGAGQKVRIELTAANTAALINKPTPSTFRVRVALASGRKVTLVSGKLTTEMDIA